MLKVELVGAGSNPRHIAIDANILPMTIGRDPRAGVRINDRWTSRRHCELNEVDGVLWVYDLGSTHGTYLNGSEVLQAPLTDGDTLQVGLSAFQVCYHSAHVPVAH